MQKDLKIGLALGLALVSVAGIWLATRPSLTPQGQLLDEGSVVPTSESIKGPFVGSRAPSATRIPERDASGTPASAGPIRRAVAERPTEHEPIASRAVHAQADTTRPQRFHIVRKDETLSQISYDYYGSAGKWRKIFEANRATVKNANVVKSGTKLIIPYE